MEKRERWLNLMERIRSYLELRDGRKILEDYLAQRPFIFPEGVPGATS